MTELFYSILSYEVFEIWRGLCMHRTFQFRLATFQVLHRHMRLVATLLNSAALRARAPHPPEQQDPQWCPAAEGRGAIHPCWTALHICSHDLISHCTLRLLAKAHSPDKG